MWVSGRKQHFVGVLGLKCRFVPDIEFFSHCGGVWWGDFQPEKSWRVGEEMISSAAGAVMITLCHLKQITNSMVLPACPFTHYTWLDRVTVNNYLVYFSKTFIHIQPLLSWRAAHFSPQVVIKCEKPIIKIKSQWRYSVATGSLHRSSRSER